MVLGQFGAKQFGMDNSEQTIWREKFRANKFMRLGNT